MVNGGGESHGQPHTAPAVLSAERRAELAAEIAAAEHPRALAVDVLFAFQEAEGYLTDAAVEEAALLLGLTPAELDELATFYNFLYREPVGRYVIHVCDSAVCWMLGQESLLEHLKRRLGVELGGTTEDGLFTLLPVCCLGYCDRAPAMLVNLAVYGELTAGRIDEVLAALRAEAKGAR